MREIRSERKNERKITKQRENLWKFNIVTLVPSFPRIGKVISIPFKGIFRNIGRYLGMPLGIFTPTLAKKRNCRLFVVFSARE